MPELPEVEVLARHLDSRLTARRITSIRILDRKSIRDASMPTFRGALIGSRFKGVRRRGKYLLLTVRRNRQDTLLLAHLGMTGRLYLADANAICSRHVRVRFNVGNQDLIFEDVRRFGGLTLDSSALNRLGPEPLGPEFTADRLGRALAGSKQPIKVRLLDQSVVAGIGNIYASEALFLAGIHPRTPSGDLEPQQIRRLRSAIRRTLAAAVRMGSRLKLDFGGASSSDNLFYYGQPASTGRSQDEPFHVYDREGEACRRCGARIIRCQQGGRSTYSCPDCQRGHLLPKRHTRAGNAPRPK